MNFLNNHKSQSKNIKLWDFLRIFVCKNKLQNMKRLIFSLIVLVTMQSAFAVDRLSIYEY